MIILILFGISGAVFRIGLILAIAHFIGLPAATIAAAMLALATAALAAKQSERALQVAAVVQILLTGVGLVMACLVYA